MSASTRGIGSTHRGVGGSRGEQGRRRHRRHPRRRPLPSPGGVSISPGPARGTQCAVRANVALFRSNGPLGGSLAWAPRAAPRLRRGTIDLRSALGTPARKKFARWRAGCVDRSLRADARPGRDRASDRPRLLALGLSPRPPAFDLRLLELRKNSRGIAFEWLHLERDSGRRRARAAAVSDVRRGAARSAARGCVESGHGGAGGAEASPAPPAPTGRGAAALRGGWKCTT